MNTVKQALNLVNQNILGKEETVSLAMISLLCQGHLLIEDIPGVGKTTMVYIFGKLLGLDISRIQFTNDLLPSDIIGTPIFKKETESFEFHKGPLFGNLILADELNRATPKTQSALLQVMEERKVSVDSGEYHMPDPFIIMATQNPYSQMGTYPLPESQLDRFFMGISLGLPSSEYEKQIIQQRDIRERIKEMNALFEKDELKEIHESLWNIHASDDLLDYLLRLVGSVRENIDGGEFLSPRAGKDLLMAARAKAFIEERDYVIPEDIQFVFPYVVGHRIGHHKSFNEVHQILKSLIKDIAC
ncbi:MAG: AAA family ATPase [Halobacteriovoraceae bacterium]|nr:AAA family ATPase [Halobacteriovoraceae bacterium]MBC97146.1 AAA family ATPase [Halobacteriovoraceae bacterium]|tara:strand:+ start:7923 stop:8828 length:906 start_codon:yes stop_codon:yes gene_type:complete